MLGELNLRNGDTKIQESTEYRGVSMRRHGAVSRLISWKELHTSEFGGNPTSCVHTVISRSSVSYFSRRIGASEGNIWRSTKEQFRTEKKKTIKNSSDARNEWCTVCAQLCVDCHNYTDDACPPNKNFARIVGRCAQSDCPRSRHSSAFQQLRFDVPVLLAMVPAKHWAKRKSQISCGLRCRMSWS